MSYFLEKLAEEKKKKEPAKYKSGEEIGKTMWKGKYRSRVPRSTFHRAAVR